MHSLCTYLTYLNSITGYTKKIQMEHAQEYNSIVFNLILTSSNGTAIQAQRICPFSTVRVCVYLCVWYGAWTGRGGSWFDFVLCFLLARHSCFLPLLLETGVLWFFWSKGKIPVLNNRIHRFCGQFFAAYQIFVCSWEDSLEGSHESQLRIRKSYGMLEINHLCIYFHKKRLKLILKTND